MFLSIKYRYFAVAFWFSGYPPISSPLLPKISQTWVKNNRRGIFEHATGSGKTFTAMCAIHDAFKRNEVVLVLVPSRDLLKQWDRELRETLLEDKIYYLLCGDSNNEWKKPGTLASWRKHKTVITKRSLYNCCLLICLF